jgi:hypothetical protein
MQHGNVVWGTRCECGHDCEVLTDRHHPWDETDLVMHLNCPGCGREHGVDREKAATHYENRIFSHFRKVRGSVLDLGCGGGLLSRYLLGQDGVSRVHGLDCDEECREQLADLLADDRFRFWHLDVADLGRAFSETPVDHVVGRDILMFVEDLDRLVLDVTSVARKGLCFMGWFAAENPRIRNRVPPEEIAEMLAAAGWSCRLDLLDWYSSGYLLTGERGGYLDEGTRGGDAEEQHPAEPDWGIGEAVEHRGRRRSGGWS